MTADEIWLNHYGPETNRNLWSGTMLILHIPIKFRIARSAKKIMVRIFEESDVLLIDYIPRARGQTVTDIYYDLCCRNSCRTYKG